LVKEWLACVCLFACALPASAGSSIVPDLATDAKLYFTAPLRWDARDWLHVGETLVVIGAAHQFDDDVRTHFIAGRSAPLDGRDPHSMRDAVQAATIIAGTWAAIFLPMFFMNVAAWAAPDREERVSFWDTAFLAGLFGFVVSTALGGSSSIGALAPAGICLVTQILGLYVASFFFDRRFHAPGRQDRAVEVGSDRLHLYRDHVRHLRRRLRCHHAERAARSGLRPLR
jgi:hypothetical protein